MKQTLTDSSADLWHWRIGTILVDIGLQTVQKHEKNFKKMNDFIAMLYETIVNINENESKKSQMLKKLAFVYDN